MDETAYLNVAPGGRRQIVIATVVDHERVRTLVVLIGLVNEPVAAGVSPAVVVVALVVVVVVVVAIVVVVTPALVVVVVIPPVPGKH